MERNPLFTKERALFYYEKIEYYYNNKAYAQALSEIEKNKDLLGAVLNVGKQLSLNKIYANSIVNFMLDTFEVDANVEYFDECFNKYRTTLELHTEPQIYALLHTYFFEKSKNQNLGSKSERLCQTAEDTIGEYVDKTKAVFAGVKQKDSKAKSIEEDFLNSIGKPYLVSQDMKAAVKTEDKLLYGSVDDFEAPVSQLTRDQKEALLTDSDMVFDEESMSLTSRVQEPMPQETQSKYKNQNAYIEQELELQNQLANKISADEIAAPQEEQLLAKIQDITPPSPSVNSKDCKSNGADPQYVKNHTINKSGGKVTELEFEHTEKPKQKSKKQNPEVRRQKPEVQEKDSAIRKQEKKPSGSSKKAKKKKRSKMPLIISLTAILILAGLGIVKSGILNNLNFLPGNFVSTDKDADKNSDSALTNDSGAGTDTTNNESVAPPSADTENGDAASSEETQIAKDYILPSDTQLLTESDLEGMDKSKVRFAINEMYARRGWHFDYGGDYYTYFSEKAWYKPDSKLKTPSDAAAYFSETENVNLATIIKYRDSLN